MFQGVRYIVMIPLWIFVQILDPESRFWTEMADSECVRFGDLTPHYVRGRRPHPDKIGTRRSAKHHIRPTASGMGHPPVHSLLEDFIYSPL